MPTVYDVVIVGARCAGATLAIELARGGASGLLIDKSPMPSELVLSTHTLHPSGMAALDALGLGDAVRAHSPEMQSLRLSVQGGQLDLHFEPGQGEYCPRRKRFDARLQEAAQAAGAELRDRTRATSLVTRGTRVCGVVVQSEDRPPETVQARLVAGADGRHSQIARWVGAEEYLGYEPPRGVYWGYFQAPRGWGRSASYPAGMYFSVTGTAMRIAFHTDDDQLLVGAAPPRAELAPFRANPLAALVDATRGDPLLAEAVARPPLEPVRGFTGDRYFFRRAVGPGWLLVGDAGHHKDFVSSDGMSEALISARAAAAASLAALGATTESDADLAFERFWRERDVAALPLFFHARDLAEPNPSGKLDRAVLNAVQAGPARDRKRFASIFSRDVSPYETLSPARILGIVASRVLRGEPSVVREFVDRARRGREVARELRRRRALLDALPAMPEGPRRCTTSPPARAIAELR